MNLAKQHENNCKISGKVVSIESREGVKDGKTYLGGTMKVETAPDNLVEVKFYANEITNKGAANKVYASLQTVVREYKSIETNGREQADSVEITGASLSENAYYTQNLAFVRDFEVRGSFFNRNKQGVDPEATFTVVGEIFSIDEEIKNDEPTGDLIVRMLVVGYGNRANVLDFKVKGEKAVGYVNSTFSKGMEVKVQGTIVVEEIITEKKEEVAFGKPIIEQTRRVRKELVITSATAPVDSMISDEERNTMLAERESMLTGKKAEMEKKNKGTTAAPKTGANFSL